MRVRAKICGVRRPETVAAAAALGAAEVGLVFYPRSPRNVGRAEAAALAAAAPPEVVVVGLFVDPEDEALDEALGGIRLDMLQLHGEESPRRAAEIRARASIPVTKAIKVSAAGDLARADAYAGVVDRLLFDAKAPGGGAYMPGGNALRFDWRMLAGRSWPLPWMLSGGLDAANVARAVRESGAPGVDVSSGVESAPGVKDPARIAAFLAAVSGI